MFLLSTFQCELKKITIFFAIIVLYNFLQSVIVHHFFQSAANCCSRQHFFKFSLWIIQSYFNFWNLLSEQPFANCYSGYFCINFENCCSRQIGWKLLFDTIFLQIASMVHFCKLFFWTTVLQIVVSNKYIVNLHLQIYNG